MRRIPQLTRWILAIALFFFVVMFALRIISLAYFAPAGYQYDGMGRIWWLGFRYDAREIGILCLLILLFGSVPALHPFATKSGRRLSFGLLTLFLVLFIILYVFDFLHFRYLLQRLNASALSFLEDAKISGTMVWQTYPVVRILIAMVLAFFVFWWVLRFLYRRVARNRFEGSRNSRIVSFVFMFLFCALAIFGRIGQYPLRWSDAFKLDSDFKANIALNPFQSFFSSLNFRSSHYDLEKVQQNYQLMAAYLGVDKPDAASLNFQRTVNAQGDQKNQPNVVLVICESFSAYKSSMWGNPLNTTPFFNELCGKGIFFDNCFTPSFGTARGVWATITGIPDVESRETASRNPSMVDQHTIINDFNGYQKFYFLGGSTSWANIRGVLSNNIKGLRIYEQDDFKASKVDVWGISDRSLFREANQILAGQQQPFFAIIQTADNHRPYTIPAEDQGEFKKISLPSDTLKKYGFENNEELNAFRFTDFCYNDFIKAASREQYSANTIFVFVGDHGISGNAGNMFPQAWSDEGLTRNHVPLLFYSPGRFTAQRLHCVASQLDLLPTLAGLAGISYTNTTLGRDLLGRWALDSGRSNVAFIYDANNQDVGVVRGPWYYTRKQQGGQEKMKWADFLSQPPANIVQPTDSGRIYTTALYETARYLLKNNHKKNK